MSATHLSVQRIPLHTIALTCEWSLHPWDSGSISPILWQSLQTIGIIHKPILLETATGFFDILCGLKRIGFFKETFQQDESIECLVIAKNTAKQILLDTLLFDQSSYSPLSLAEKARFIEICTRFFSKQDIVSLYLDKLHLRKQLSTIDELASILNQDPTIISEIHAGRLQEKIIGELLRLPVGSDRLAMALLFKELGLGEGKQKKLFTQIRDLAFRQNASITEFLKTQTISKILNHQVLNVPQKQQHLNHYLQQQLCPMHEKTEDDFLQQVRALHLSSRCSVTHIPSFEKDEITLSITFDNFSQCARMAPLIDKVVQDNNSAFIQQ